MDLATGLHAFVFSRLLGFSEQTAANWMAESGGDDAPYAGHRVHAAPGTLSAVTSDSFSRTQRC